MGGIERVGVVGCGVMGAGIVEACARAGASVVVAEADRAAADRGRQAVERSIDRAVASERLSGADADAARARVRYVTEVGALADRQFVIEAVAELEELKGSVLAAVDRTVAPDTIIATNTSSLPIARLAARLIHPERLLGLHFFNPVPLMPLVEVVPCLATAPEVIESAERFVVDTLDKQVIRAPDRAGFVVNALLVPYLLSAIRMVERGFADPVTVDTGMERGCAHPLGPLRLADLIGLDTLLHIAHALHDEYHEAQFVPPQLLSRMVESGHLGRKSGGGFYEY